MIQDIFDELVGWFDQFILQKNVYSTNAIIWTLTYMFEKDSKR